MLPDIPSCLCIGHLSKKNFCLMMFLLLLKLIYNLSFQFYDRKNPKAKRLGVGVFPLFPNLRILREANSTTAIHNFQSYLPAFQIYIQENKVQRWGARRIHTIQYVFPTSISRLQYSGNFLFIFRYSLSHGSYFQPFSRCQPIKLKQYAHLYW